MDAVETGWTKRLGGGLEPTTQTLLLGVFDQLRGPEADEWEARGATIERAELVEFLLVTLSEEREEWRTT